MAVGAVRERPDAAGEGPVVASSDGVPGLSATGEMPPKVLAGLLILSLSVIVALIGGTLWAGLDRPGGADTPDTPPASTSAVPESVNAQPQKPSSSALSPAAPAPPPPAPAAAQNPSPAAPAPAPAPQTQQYVPPPAPVEVAPDPPAPAPAPAPAAPPPAPAPALPDILAPILPFLVPPPPPPPAP
ncbi:hypothetical protein ACWDUL_00205 [Nocardia niigatensis]